MPNKDRAATTKDRRCKACGYANDKGPASDVSSLLTELDRLRGENRILRDSALTFGALAERLNIALRQERRSGQESIH